jgi:hypothetical protein
MGAGQHHASSITSPRRMQKNWPAFEQAARDFGKLRIDRRMAMRSAHPDLWEGGQLGIFLLRCGELRPRSGTCRDCATNKENACCFLQDACWKPVRHAFEIRSTTG